MSNELQDLLEDGYIEGVDESGIVFAGPERHGLRILDSRFVEADLSGAKLIGCRLADVEFQNCRATDVSFAKSSLQDVTVAESRIGAFQGFGGSWTRCAIAGGKIDYLNLRAATVARLTIDNAVIGELDLSEAKIEGISFLNATVGKLILTNARTKRLDLRGVELRGLESNPEGLRGVVIGPTQVLDLAPVLADILGMKIA